eukprot:3731702-Amphidinium_carterae.2
MYAIILRKNSATRTILRGCRLRLIMHEILHPPPPVVGLEVPSFTTALFLVASAATAGSQSFQTTVSTRPVLETSSYSIWPHLYKPLSAEFTTQSV